MSKCDIQITFDKPNRQYRGGDVVSGKVHVSVNQDIRCNGIVLKHYWQTHGYGNRDQGTQREIRLCEMQPLQAGERLELSFEFTSECWPLTYHGYHINVDHYVHVAVDVPWAIDPKHSEEYILVTGKRPAEFTGSRGELVELSKPTSEMSSVAKWVLFGVFGIFGLMLAFLFLFLIPVILLGFAGVWGWRKLIASRVGNVELRAPHVVVGPGESWPIELGFTPGKSFLLNGITLKLSARETATSGSGTDRTTSRHSLYDETTTLYPSGMLMAGERFSEQFALQIPDIPAWTLDESDNKLEWWAEVRIDIPNFPDWKRTVNLQMIPSEFLDALPDKTLRSATRNGPNDQHAVPAAESQTSPMGASPDGQAANECDIDSLNSVISEIRTAPRFGNERNDIVNALAGRTYDVNVEIDRSSTTFGFRGDDKRFENGRTVIGTIQNSEQEVQLFAVSTNNNQIEDLARGDLFRTQATVQGWDSLYDRLVLHEVPLT